MRPSFLHPCVLVLASVLAAGCSDEIQDDAATGSPGEVAAEVEGRTQGTFDLERALRLTPPIANDYGPFHVQLGNSTFAALTQTAIPAGMEPILPPGVGGAVYGILFRVESTGELELFGLYVPGTDPTIPRPLLTAFHGFGTSHRDIDVRTSFYAEAAARDWFLIAPLQRNLADPNGANFDISYGSAKSQLHVDAVIEYVKAFYNVDLDRFYGVGFSMGGGAAVSYAARNRDWTTGAFAAVVNHTGTIALRDEYAALDQMSPVRDVMEMIFGGTPSVVPFEWDRASAVVLDSAGLVDPDGNHMAVNLRSVPLLSVYNAQDSLDHLVNQTTQLHGFVSQLPGGHAELLIEPGGIPNCIDQHCWATLDETFACDWLATHSLNRTLSSGKVLADRSARWEAFEVEQIQEGVFSSFEYDVAVSSNRLSLLNVENCSRISVDVSDLGFDPAQPIKIALFSGVADGFQLELRGFPTRPLEVARLSLPLLESCQPTAGVNSWCHDPGEATVSLFEFPSGPVDWRVVP